MKKGNELTLSIVAAVVLVAIVLVFVVVGNGVTGNAIIYPSTAKTSIVINNDGDNSVGVTANIKDGQARFNVLWGGNYLADDAEFIAVGRDRDERLSTSSDNRLDYNQTVHSTSYHKWFVVSYASSTEKVSYLLSASITETDGINRTSIKNMVTNQDVCMDKVEGDICNIGPISLVINKIYKNPYGRSLSFTIIRDGSGEVSFNKLYDIYGSYIILPSQSNLREVFENKDIPGPVTQYSFPVYGLKRAYTKTYDAYWTSGKVQVAQRF